MPYNPKSKENLIDVTTRGYTHEQLSEFGRRGAIAKKEKDKKRKELKELAQIMLEMPMEKGKLEDFTNYAELKGKNITVAEALMAAQIQKAKNGSTKAFEFIRDTAGYKPIEQSKIEADVRDLGKIGDIINALGSDDDLVDEQVETNEPKQ